MTDKLSGIWRRKMSHGEITIGIDDIEIFFSEEAVDKIFQTRFDIVNVNINVNGHLIPKIWFITDGVINIEFNDDEYTIASFDAEFLGEIDIEDDYHGYEFRVLWNGKPTDDIIKKELGLQLEKYIENVNVRAKIDDAIADLMLERKSGYRDMDF